jgi:hypothetical protein
MKSFKLLGFSYKKQKTAVVGVLAKRHQQLQSKNICSRFKKRTYIFYKKTLFKLCQ